MAIGLICRNCGTKLKVAEKAAGKIGKCPKCKKPIRIPKTVSQKAHFCDDCGKSLAGLEDVHMISDKIFCGDCFNKTQNNTAAKAPNSKPQVSDPILEQIGIDIPGMVVLRGKDQRKMGRMLQDVSAKKGFKTETKKRKKDDKAPEEAAEAPAEAPPEPAPAQPEEPAATPGQPPEVAPGFDVPVETAQPEAPPKKKAPKAPPMGAVAPGVAKLGKGKRASDESLIKLLIDQGIVLEGELELALQYQKGLSKRLIPVLDDLKLTSEEEVAKAIAQASGLESCPAGDLEIAPHVEGLLDDEMISLYEVIPLTREDDAIVAAFPNPLDLDAVKGLREIIGKRIIPKVCTWEQYKDGRKVLKARASV